MPQSAFIENAPGGAGGDIGNTGATNRNGTGNVVGNGNGNGTVNGNGNGRKNGHGRKSSEATVPAAPPPVVNEKGSKKRRSSKQLNEKEPRASTTSDAPSATTTVRPASRGVKGEKGARTASDTASEEPWTFAAQLAKDIQGTQERGLNNSKGLTLSWKDLSVRGRGGLQDIQYKPDLLSLFWPFRAIHMHHKFNKVLDKLAAKEPPAQKVMHYSKGDPVPKRGQPGLRKGERYLIHDFTGCLKPGELMMVVGRPGSGCSTLLKTLAGLTSSYAGVDGAVYYGSIKAGSREMRPFRSDVIFNGEEDVHDPNLLVERTMDFALRMQAPSKQARPLNPTTGKPISRHAWVEQQKTTILKAFGIDHTRRTKVGDQYVRGVSGGEKKRVSLAEALAADAQIYFWDNATRGLDASTALAFANLCRTLCDVANRVNVMSLYQAGNGIYDLCDKITVVAEGHIIYFGPRVEARPYFEALGFEHTEGANTADYLTAVTAHNERRVMKGFEGRVPNTAAEFAEVYRKSELYARMLNEADAALNDKAEREAEANAMKEYIKAEKSSISFKALPYKADIFEQIYAVTIREVQVRWGDQWSLWGRQVTTIIQGFINGSVFYKLPRTTNGLFLRGGALFMLVLFPAILSFADVQSAFVGRAVLAKHKSYSMYAPAGIIFAQTIADFPIFFIQMVCYVVITYWLCHLKSNGGLFWAAIVIAFFVTNAVTALFRTIGYSFGNYQNASKVSGTIFTIFILYSGYIIYTPDMKRWFSWLRWVNPVYYGIESLIANEFDGLTFQCVSPNLVPSGPSYAGGPAGCAIAGARPNEPWVSGKTYMHVALWFHKKDNWRNLAIITALWVSSAVIGMFMLEMLPSAGSTKTVLLFKQGGGGEYIREAAKKGLARMDEEDGPGVREVIAEPRGADAQLNAQRMASDRGEQAREIEAAGDGRENAFDNPPTRTKSRVPKLMSRQTFGQRQSGDGNELRRWGTTEQEIAPREWPAESLARTISNPSQDPTAYRERKQRRASVSSGGSPPALRREISPVTGRGPLDRMDESVLEIGEGEIGAAKTMPPTMGGAVAPTESGGAYHTPPMSAQQTRQSMGGPLHKAPTQVITESGEVALKGTTFTWKDLDYTVKADGKDKQLLRKVTGYCKAGTITALMGSSGAGKTTLMDVLAARKDEGVISGEVLLNGHPLPMSFQRTTGYCEQVDVHLPESTVREALEFSALLRQPRHIPDKEKLAYVDEIIDLLELHDIADAIIGRPGEGLGVEQRKRLTIGVELVSRPSLLFLDEPTSGLDGQSSYLIVGFLQKLAAAGQSILCTIHQPSAALFAGFDMLLLLKAGGRTVYFGPVEDVPDYFIEKGVEWPKDVNPAEFMIDIVSGPLSTQCDWSQVWLESDEHKQMLVDLEAVKAAAARGHTDTTALEQESDSAEFASTTLTQMRLVFFRSSLQLYRNTEYVVNKCLLHIATALITGFSFWKLGSSYADLKNRVFVLFQFAFVAPGVMVQTQPKFIANRDIFEAREKKAKFYSWQVFCFGEIVAEVPYLLLCAVLFWGCWYPTAGLNMHGRAAGPVFLQMVFYEFLYTGMGQFIAAYAPNPVFAAMVLPLFIATLAIFSGILVPYYQITPFWRYTMYYVDPFTYLLKGLLTFPIWHQKVRCKPGELGYFFPPEGQTCGQYLAEFFRNGATGYLVDENRTDWCAYCPYRFGYQYLATMHIKHHVNGWEGILVTLLFVCSSYALVFLLLKLRSKATKTAS